MPAPVNDGAAGAALIERQEDESPGAGGAEAFEGQQGNPNEQHSAQTAPGLQPEGDAQADRKLLSTLQAQLALRGFVLSRTEGANGPATYAVTRWGLVRELATLDDVAAFSRRVGGPT